ncbi:MAG: Fic family protein [Deltaproteobacteria bacterium]|nr:Fic family protein [Deltaproteobacteria bacterium]
MPDEKKVRFSDPLIVFRDRRLPERARPAGYSALIEGYGLRVPLPRTLLAIGQHHRIIEADGFRILTPRHAPHATLEGHLTFALKYEGVDLAILKCLFLKTGPGPIESMVRRKPTGSYVRRIWFLYEWLCGAELELPDATGGRDVPVLDPELQIAPEGERAARYRIRDNLPGTPEFCPLVFRTEALDRVTARELKQRAREVLAECPRDLLSRAAAFLLLNDSKSSFAIEGEHPPQDRIQRWAGAIAQAGKQPLDRDELLRLQGIVIGDSRFVKLGFREAGGFVGEHDRETRMPLPDHISARPEDLPSLIDGLIHFGRSRARDLDPVIAAAALAFGFIYIHPFEDGNGRLHRYLIHHVLAERGFVPPGLVFPVSAAILERIGSYRDALESYSQRLLPLVEWEPTERGNVRVLNDTGDYYRFFDATPQAEFLYACVESTIEHDLPRETDFLRRSDRFRLHVQDLFDMPASKLDLLFHLLQQNGGHLSKRVRAAEFGALTDGEAERIEAIYRELFPAVSRHACP